MFKVFRYKKVKGGRIKPQKSNFCVRTSVLFLIEGADRVKGRRRWGGGRGRREGGGGRRGEGKGSVPVDFLRPKFRVVHTKHDVISILMNKYTYINMYIIKKIISCIFILCWDITALLKLKWKFAGYVHLYRENRENLNGDLPHFAPKNDKLP